MSEFDEDRRRPVPEADPNRHATELTEAAARLHEAIDALNQAFLSGTAVEKATRRDAFNVALATYTAQIDATPPA